MMRILKNIFMWGTTYTYSNISRLFIRLFVGILLLKFGISHMLKFAALSAQFPEVLGMSGSAALSCVIGIELICSLLLMTGLLTRYACIPALFTMILAIVKTMSCERYSFVENLADIDLMDPVYIPVLFSGILIYLLLAGPGKISLDYLISLHLINKNEDFQDDDKLTEA